MKTLAILGASGHGKVVADTALSSGWDDVVFFDGASSKFLQNRFVGRLLLIFSDVLSYLHIQVLSY